MPSISSYFIYICCFLILGMASCNHKKNTFEKEQGIVQSSNDTVIKKHREQEPPKWSRAQRISKHKSIIDSINATLQWRKLNCGLWINKDEDIGFETSEAAMAGEESFFIKRYIRSLYSADEHIALKSVIDTTTFRYLGSSFYKDKHHIYNHYTMASGGYFEIYKKADHKTFAVIGDCYAKHPCRATRYIIACRLQNV